MPEPPISSQPVYLHVRQPLPPGARLVMCVGALTPAHGFRDAVWAADILQYVIPDLLSNDCKLDMHMVEKALTPIADNFFILSGAHQTITSGEVKVTGDRAFDVGTYKQTLMSQKGGGTIDDHGKYVVLMKKDASGAWWVTHAIYNSDVPLPAPPASAKK